LLIAVAEQAGSRDAACEVSAARVMARRCASRYTRRSRRAGADGGSPVTQTDKALLIIALILGVLDVLNIRGPLARFSAAGIAIVLLAVVELHRGGVFSY